MKLLDCTLRDGGYYTSWDFPSPLVSRYLNSLAASNIDVVELGLRGFPKDEFLGAYAYTTDELINSLNVPEKLDVAVMIDAKTILNYEGEPEEAIGELFVERNLSPVTMVRVAAHFDEVESCGRLTKVFKSLGYTLGFNLMQAGGRSERELMEKAAVIDSWNTVDVLYFADSLGNMDALEVTRIYESIKASWKGDVGIHAHNNQGRALDNTLIAHSLGVEWLDSTILGMGRGAGNSSTELLVLELEKDGGKYYSTPLWKVVIDDFQPLQAKYSWGTSLLYYFAAENDIHPTYVQNLLAEDRYTSDQVIQALKYIAPLKASSYSTSLLHDSLSGCHSEVSSVRGSWDATDWCKGRDVLVIGAGSSVSKYEDAIESFIKRKNTVTLSLNIHNNVSEDLIDGYIAIDPLRLLLEINNYSNLNKPLFSSLTNLSGELLDAMNGLDVKDYGVNIEANTFDVKDNYCTIPSLLSLAYAFGLVKIGGGDRIWLVGFDGYTAGDKRQDEMIQMLDVVKLSEHDINCISLTPSTYPLNQGSIYAPY